MVIRFSIVCSCATLLCCMLAVALASLITSKLSKLERARVAVQALHGVAVYNMLLLTRSHEYRLAVVNK